MAVTLQQIASRSGVATSTVSAVLSPVCKKRVSQKKMQEIRNIAKKMGYRPNVSARRLRTGQTLNIGVVVNSFLSHHPMSTYFDLISLACVKRGYHAIPLVVERDYANMPKQLNMLENHHVDGLIFMDYVRQSYDQYLQFWQHNHPMVFRFLHPHFTSLPFEGILVNHNSAHKKLFSHVLSEGWTNLCFVTEAVEGVELFWEGEYGRFCDEIAERSHGRKCCFDVIKYERRDAASRYRAIQDFIGANPVHKGHTAFILDGGDGSSGVYGALKEAGLVIGKDVAVGALNCVPKNEFVSPSLTTLSEPFEEIAEALVTELLQNLEDGQVDRISVAGYEPELVIGASTTRSAV